MLSSEWYWWLLIVAWVCFALLMIVALLGDVTLRAGMMMNRPGFLGLVSSMGNKGTTEKPAQLEMNWSTGSGLGCYCGP